MQSQSWNERRPARRKIAHIARDRMTCAQDVPDLMRDSLVDMDPTGRVSNTQWNNRLRAERGLPRNRADGQPPVEWATPERLRHSACISCRMPPETLLFFQAAVQWPDTLHVAGLEGSAQGLPVRLALGGHKNPGGIIVEAVHEPSLEAALPGLH